MIMANLIAPIYTATLNGKPLRFFNAPYAAPHLPWHSYDDVLRCIGAKQSVRNEVLSVIRAVRPHDVQTTSCGLEILLIAPHYAARWFIKNIRGSMPDRPKQNLLYRVAMIDALYASVRGNQPHVAEDLVLQAFRNTDLAEAGGCEAWAI